MTLTATCDTCRQQIRFSASLLYGTSLQSCGCGQRAIPIVRPAKVFDSTDPSYRSAYRKQQRRMAKQIPSCRTEACG